MPGFQVEIKVDGNIVKTLADLLPERPGLRMLIVGKTPIPESVDAGHYFQGTHGTTFWNLLTKYGIVEVLKDRFEDEVLLDHGFGITDIVKVPRHYGDEPTRNEYATGAIRIRELVLLHHPYIVMFVYKKILDQMLKHGFGLGDTHRETAYGFNPKFESVFGCELFVFPMPGTPCPGPAIRAAMQQLRARISGRKDQLCGVKRQMT